MSGLILSFRIRQGVVTSGQYYVSKRMNQKVRCTKKLLFYINISHVLRLSTMLLSLKSRLRSTIFFSSTTVLSLLHFPKDPLCHLVKCPPVPVLQVRCKLELPQKE